jgi:hypothetical protein
MCSLFLVVFALAKLFFLGKAADYCTKPADCDAGVDVVLLDRDDEPRDVGFLFCRVDKYPGLVPKLNVMLESLLNHSTVDLRFHVFACDQRGFDVAVESIERISSKLGRNRPTVRH